MRALHVTVNGEKRGRPETAGAPAWLTRLPWWRGGELPGASRLTWPQGRVRTTIRPRHPVNYRIRARDAPSARLDPERLGDHLDRLYRAGVGAVPARARTPRTLVQETYAAVLRKPRRLHSDDDLGYLLRVLRNTFVLPGRRAAARRAQTISLPADLDLVEDSRAVRGGVPIWRPPSYSRRSRRCPLRLPRRGGGDRRDRALLPGGRTGPGRAGRRRSTTRLHRGRQRLVLPSLALPGGWQSASGGGSVSTSGGGVSERQAAPAERPRRSSRSGRRCSRRGARSRRAGGAAAAMPRMVIPLATVTIAAGWGAALGR